MSMGFRFCRSKGMEGSTGNLREFPINPANTNPIYTGDLVNLNGGYVQEASGAASGATFDVLGVFMGCRYVAADGSYDFKPMWDGGAGRSSIFAHVITPSGATLMVPGDPVSAYTAADIGTLKGIIYNAGVPRTGMSGVTLGATGATVANGALRVVQRLDLPDADAPWFEVSVARSQLL